MAGGRRWRWLLFIMMYCDEIGFHGVHVHGFTRRAVVVQQPAATTSTAYVP